jgi:predicted cupin superfamily sugar epimerase
VTDKRSFTLVSCNMSPGFHFEDFEMLMSRELKRQFPQHAAIIDKLTSLC